MNQAGDTLEKVLNQFLEKMVTKSTKEQISAGEEMRLINEIVKDNLLDALTAFGPDLPAQYSTQILSKTMRIRDNNQVLRDRKELHSFLTLYKLELENILTMISDNNKQEDGESWKKEKQENIDDMKNIRSKMRNYQGFFEKLYEIIQKNGIDNINLTEFGNWTENFKNTNQEAVERQKEDEH